MKCNTVTPKIVVLILFIMLPYASTFAQNECPSGTFAPSWGKYTDGSGVLHQASCFDTSGKLVFPYMSTSSGNAALKYPAASHIIFADPNGSDSNDGLSEGTPKLNPQTAFDTATVNGTVSGTVILAPGNYSCPTTFYSNMDVHSYGRQYPFAYVLSLGFNGTNSGALFGCITGTNVTIGPDIANLWLDGVGFNFNNAGGSLVINSVSTSRFDRVSVELGGSNTQDCLQIKVNATSGVQHNTAHNLFNDLALLCNTAGAGTQANGITLTGQGAVNSGVDVTDNYFTNTTITGGLKHCVDFEKNTDSNFFSGLQCNNTGTAQGDVLIFNSTTPASDQDADAITVIGAASTGSFSHPVSLGQSNGNHIQLESAAEIVPNILGGTPSYILETTMLSGGGDPVFNINGAVLSSGKAKLTGQTSGSGPTTILTTIAANNLYIIEGAITCNSASASATASVTITYTDVSNTTVTTAPVTATCTTLGTASNTGVFTAVNAKASTAIRYTTSIANTPNFDLRLSVRRMTTQ